MSFDFRISFFKLDLGLNHIINLQLHAAKQYKAEKNSCFGDFRETGVTSYRYFEIYTLICQLGDFFLIVIALWLRVGVGAKRYPA